MLLHEYRPRSRLVTPQTLLERPRFPAIDAHDHLGQAFGGGWMNRPVTQLLDTLDQVDIQVFVDLDGGWGESILQAHLDHFKAAAPQRFIHAGGVDWSAWAEHSNRFGEWAANRFRLQASWGAQALKIWKVLGTAVRDDAGAIVMPDDPRLDPLWAAAGELRLPVVVHVADPVAFFDSQDRFNERWEELQEHPDWHFPSPAFPPFLEIITRMATVVQRHPHTIFIGAHVGWYAENLDWVSGLLESCPNFYVDIGARISELGRQPYASRRFFLRHSDRILFGTDAGPDPDTYRIYYRFLESEDEYFSYDPGEIPGQGRWMIYGLHLPDEVLEKVYAFNARLVFGLAG